MDSEQTTSSDVSTGTPQIVNTKSEPRVYDVNRENAQANNTILKRPIILGDLTLGSPTTVTTIGANGTATALTANPVGYLIINLGNGSVQIPYYTVL
jgi:hypothetical protein